MKEINSAAVQESYELEGRRIQEKKLRRYFQTEKKFLKLGKEI